jgi:TusA-related sulfurtransferase
MQTSLNVNLSLSFHQLVELARQLPKKERAELASILIDDEPSKEQILQGLQAAIEEVNLAKQGKIKLKSAREFINEL